MAKTLSVCIPTFSNPVGIEATLRNLFSQITENALYEKVEFCIADNSEDSATESIVRTLKATGPIPMQYLRHGQNLGYDRNVDAVLKLASGEYCWILSDNEIVKPNALTEIVRGVEAHKNSGVLVICPDNVPAEKIRTYKNMEAAMTANNWWVPGGLVSRNVVRKALIPHDLSSYFNNDWLHLSVTLAIGGSAPVTFLPELFISEPNETSRWAKGGKTFVTYTNLLHILETLPQPPYSTTFVRNMTAVMRRGLPHNILSAKLYGLTVSRATLALLYRATKGNWLWLVLSFGALMTPTIVVRYAKRFKNSFGS